MRTLSPNNDSIRCADIYTQNAGTEIFLDWVFTRYYITPEPLATATTVEGADASPTVTLTAPVNDANLTSTQVNFECTATDDNVVENFTLFIDNTSNYTHTGESDNETTVADLIKDRMASSPEEEMLSQSRREVMENLLSTLNPQQAHVIRLRYGLFDGRTYTLAQIGKQMNISRERVRQIEAEALSKLRHPARRHYWEELFE